MGSGLGRLGPVGKVLDRKLPSVSLPPCLKQVQHLAEGLLGSACPEEGKKVRFEESEGAITGLGFIAAQLVLGACAAACAWAVLRREGQRCRHILGMHTHTCKLHVCWAHACMRSCALGLCRPDALR